MIRRPPRSTRTDTLFPYTTLFRSRSVHLYARSVRAQQQWVSRAGGEGVRVGPYRVDPAARTVDGRAYDLILVFYGWEPQAAFADGLALQRDPHGYIRTDAGTAEASVPSVYAIGEVAHRMHPCVVTSLADELGRAPCRERRW